MEKPSTSGNDDFRRSVLEFLSRNRIAIEDESSSMAEVGSVLRFLTLQAAQECPDDKLYQSIVDCGGDWWGSGPQGGQIPKIVRIGKGSDPREPEFEARARQELQEFVARVISLMRSQ